MSDHETAETAAATDTNGTTYYRVKILHSSETQICVWSGEEALEHAAMVIVPTRYGLDMGKVLGSVESREEYSDEDVYPIDRVAGEEDLEIYRENLEKEEEAFEICRKKIKEHNLDMKLVSSHYLLGEDKVMFFFTADSRVDFRELVKDLVSVFKMRIELRQIGVRDESRVQGGHGVCGRVFCCHGVTDRLQPVSIKMAKEQNLSLNSMKISGPCGRLLCCLAYEHEFYREEKRRYPPEGIRIRVDDHQYRVVEVNVINRKIRISGPDGGFFVLRIEDFSYDSESGRWTILRVPES